MMTLIYHKQFHKEGVEFDITIHRNSGEYETKIEQKHNGSLVLLYQYSDRVGVDKEFVLRKAINKIDEALKRHRESLADNQKL